VKVPFIAVAGRWMCPFILKVMMNGTIHLRVLLMNGPFIGHALVAVAEPAAAGAAAGVAG
jgi:hypothetical protein